MTTMKAIRVHEYGGPEVLRYEDAPRPLSGAAEVLVRVHAASVNAFDWKVRSGMLKAMIPLSLPWIPGSDFSGVVESVGSSVTDLKAGDEVYGKSEFPRHGSYAEFVVAQRSALAAKPRSINHAQAAAVPVAALTAWQALFGDNRGPGLGLSADQTVLIIGATGGVGSFAVQLAKGRGARVIAAYRRSGQESELLKLGADTVINLEQQRLEVAGQVDAVLDLVGGDLQKQAWPLIKQGGALASALGQPSEPKAQERGVRSVAVSMQASATELADVAKLIDTGALKVVVSENVPLESASRAHELMEAGGVRGKIVLTVTHP